MPGRLMLRLLAFFYPYTRDRLDVSIVAECSRRGVD